VTQFLSSGQAMLAMAPQVLGLQATALLLAPGPAETGLGIAGPVSETHLPRSLDSGSDDTVTPSHEQATAEIALDGLVEADGAIALAPAAAELPAAGPHQGSLLFGPLSIDVAALQRNADAFFTHLAGLARDVAGSDATRLFWWLLAAAVAAGTLEVARRRLALPPESPPISADERGDLRWAPFPVLAVLPPE
jgi:hypothetical protein